MTTKEKSTIQENIVKLYLRLNGYISTGLIIHSSEKRISGEIDIVAVRFPYHSQNDTEHNSSPFMEIPNTIDVIIGEVKSHGRPLKFNKSLRNENLISLTKAIKWIGLFKEEQINEISVNLLQLIKPAENSNKTAFNSLPIKTEFGLISLRPILFSPETISSNSRSDKFVGWQEINNFLWDCLCPENVRNQCGTRYDFGIWGPGLSEIVKVYKDRQEIQKRYTNITELYIDLKVLK